MSRTYKPFSGPFAPMLQSFIDQKHALGYDYIGGYWILRSFDSFSKAYDVQEYSLTKDIVHQWSIQRPNESEIHRSARVLELQKFALFLNSKGYGGYISPPHRHPKSTHTPYIFSYDELRKIFAEVDSMAISPYSPYKHIAFPLLYRMLYGCGFRIAELLNLRLGDVDVKEGIVHIRHGKNDNERLVPMVPSLTRRCADYIDLLHKSHDLSHPFFFKKDGSSYSVSNIEKDFRELLWLSGIPYRGKDVGPRVHDIRHTFVCHRLNQWARNDVDLTNTLPILSKYIGHSSVTSTQWYLRITAEVFPDIAEKMEALTGTVFPEIGGDEV